MRRRNPSYLIDIPEGGRAYVIGNGLEKGARSQNPNAISFAAERRDADEGGLWVVNNTFYDRQMDAIFVANRGAGYDFRLTAQSPLIDTAEDPGAGEVALWRQFEYVHPAGGRARQRVGALEFCGW